MISWDSLTRSTILLVFGVAIMLLNQISLTSRKSYTTVSGKAGQDSKFNLGRVGKYIIALILVIVTFFTSCQRRWKTAWYPTSAHRGKRHPPRGGWRGERRGQRRHFRDDGRPAAHHCRRQRQEFSFGYAGPFYQIGRAKGHLGLYKVDTILLKYYGESCGLTLENGAEGHRGGRDGLPAHPPEGGLGMLKALVAEVEVLIRTGIVLEALDYIGTHYNDSGINTGAIAQHLGRSEGHLIHLFKKETDYTLNNYLTRYHVHKAMEFLRDCRARVYEVAEQAGYKDITYFSAAFKKLVGMSPSQYQDTSR